MTMPQPASGALHSAPFHLVRPGSSLRRAVTAAYRRPESAAVAELSAQATFAPDALARIRTRAKTLVERVRAERSRASGVDALMNEFALSSEEGIALMCLAEALLRIPDRATADRLIRDKLARGDWRAHLGGSESLFVNAATWGLVVTGKFARSQASASGLAGTLTGILERLGEPVIRAATKAAMGFLGDQFVLGETIDDALNRARRNETRGYRYSYDMLGEAAMTMADADRYQEAYVEAIHAIGRTSARRGVYEGPGISVKLSALHPRYSHAQHARVVTELLPRLKALLLIAKGYDIGLNIDAEEADRLEISLDLVETLALDPELAGWNGFGFVVQAFQKRCPFVLDWLFDLARRSGLRFMVRLVKGAYWDTEVKRAQVDGMDDYPVYTRKVHTDISYLACARKLLAHPKLVYPQFATHNASTLSAVVEIAQDNRDFEFQCLHGMGETLYDKVVGEQDIGLACRIYAPVGTHETLLAYLVRRLLENGANSSFVNQIVDPEIPVDRLLEDPVTAAKLFDGSPHPRVPMPADLFPDRRNSRGIDLTDEIALAELERALNTAGKESWRAAPMLGDGKERFDAHQALPVASPVDFDETIGYVAEATAQDVERALTFAREKGAWAAASAHERATILERAADLLEDNAARLIYLAVREAGKTIPNAIGEVREAADFCRYYALRARADTLGTPLGAVACISPWNFPLAIFTGQVAAALAAGNAVLAKPAEQTPLIAAEAVRLLRAAGVPAPALQLLPGAGETVGARLIGDARVQGVVFTGSTEVAEIIHRTLAERGNVPLIAETGGQNAMIVDSSALPEQVVADVLSSSFDSAGQRCSALRVLFLQQEIAERILEMLRGAMRELAVGDPALLATDIGPIIDASAKRGLVAYIAQMEKSAKLVARTPLPEGANGHFLAPVAFEIESIRDLHREVFGPVLHVVRYRSDELARVVDDINASGYGLTLGIHSRLDSTIDFIVDRAHVGNIYVNRNVIGAVVGVQPFGGECKSGTGPKAGGPLYLRALVRRIESSGDTAQIGAPVGADTRAADLAGAQSALANAQSKLPGIDRAAVLAALSRHADPAVATIAREYSKALGEGDEHELPGPTGERDSWRLEPRGLAVALGAERDQMAAWLGQALAAVTAGDPVLLVSERDGAAATKVAALVRDAGWPAIAAASDGEGRWSSLPELAVVIVGDGGLAARATKMVAARSGARIPVVEPAGAPWCYPTWRLATERCVSVNTVAAGGNAYLLAQID
jgi:RHH-type proline utilization regulon transcriptional repressor/proline dehydrogenase/delta 1-pyrroline-5-carboxylate dehydrogenase